MSKKIVGMISDYKALNQRDWLWQQTPHPFGVWGNIQMIATADKPDFLLLYNFRNFPQENSQSQKKQVWQFWQGGKNQQQDQRQLAMQAKLHQVPQERIICLVREPPLKERTNARINEYKQAQKYCGYVSGPDDFAPIPEYMPAIWYHANSFRELNEMKPPQKNQPCCWITSGISRTASHRRRLAFLQSLTESEIKFDLYGRNLPNYAPGYGSVSNKWNAIAPYYYNLAIENYAENEWYVSEKLWDALLAWCLPIYFGGSAADKLLPPGSFLRLPSLDEKGIAYIRDITSNLDAWYEAQEAISEARQIILHELNLLNWLSNFVTKFG